MKILGRDEGKHVVEVGGVVRHLTDDELKAAQATEGQTGGKPKGLVTGDAKKPDGTKEADKT